jgi:hypothetical protein
MSNEFKSLRAAKTAMTKAIKAYQDAKNVWAEANVASDLGARDRAEPAVAAAADAMQAVYDAAHAQGFYVSCAYCGENTTRALIAANID